MKNYFKVIFNNWILFLIVSVIMIQRIANSCLQSEYKVLAILLLYIAIILCFRYWQIDSDKKYKELF